MGVIIRFRNLKDMPCILKLPEMVFCFIIVVVAREGGHAADGGSLVETKAMWNVPWGGTMDTRNLGTMTAFGFMLIVLGQTCGYLCGERSMVQNGLVNLVGALCFISIGSLQISYFRDNEKRISSSEYAGDAYYSLAVANGALAIVNGAVWMADSSYCLLQAYYD